MRLRPEEKHSFSTRILKSPVGRLIARPWLDACILYFLKNRFFPLSRLWAAARAAEGDVDKFIEHIPLAQPNKRQRRQIAKALYYFDRARLKAFSTEQLWRDYFFGPDEVAAERLPIVEEMRLDNRITYNMTRRLFRPLKRLVKTSVRISPPTPAEVAERYGPQGEKLAAPFKTAGKWIIGTCRPKIVSYITGDISPFRWESSIIRHRLENFLKYYRMRQHNK